MPRSERGAGERERNIPLPDEPYLPDSPPWPPHVWPQERWNAWWRAIINWCRYQERRWNEILPPLSPPPPLGATEAEWLLWRDELAAWKPMEYANQPVVWPEFPPGWLSYPREAERLCVLCAADQGANQMRQCPRCASFVCRECLFLSKDACPVDGFVDDFKVRQ